jgi:hypothetical protein
MRADTAGNPKIALHDFTAALLGAARLAKQPAKFRDRLLPTCGLLEPLQHVSNILANLCDRIAAFHYKKRR